jgi:hypothetical protein
MNHVFTGASGFLLFCAFITGIVVVAWGWFLFLRELLNPVEDSDQ